MPEGEKKSEEPVGQPGCLNKNCWLAKTLNHSPYSRCQYCELKFHQCIFLHYQIISIVLISLFLTLFFLIEGRVSELVIICIFTLVIVYGYFLNKSTDKIIKANFAQREAKLALEKLAEKLEERVDEQTKDIGEKNKYLEELLNMKTDFLRVVNHQLNTPLAVMKGYFSMMEEGSYPPAKARPAIKGGLERISSTVSDFWDAYELEGEKMKMEPQKTDIAQIVNGLIPEKQNLQLALERKLKIEVQKPEFSAQARSAFGGEIPLVWCDYKKIAHVISNLLDNAIYYTRQGGVTVFYELVGKNYLKINIKDTGSGISKQDQKKLFQKFSRLKNATDLRPDGSGLGLFIAKKIIQGNDGEITCFSEGADKGSTFSFTLPIYKNQKLTSEGEKSPIKEEKIVIFGKNN
ncbi:MAG: HAMP domain-containing sensor histidine kinase [Candidatus Buchananbacteria bacterium]